MSEATPADREAAREWYSRKNYGRIPNIGTLNDLAELVATGRALGLAAARPTWTGTPPTEAGWYWFRTSPLGSASMVFQLIPADAEKRIYPACQWCGPIPFPAEPTV